MIGLVANLRYAKRIRMNSWRDPGLRGNVRVASVEEEIVRVCRGTRSH